MLVASLIVDRSSLKSKLRRRSAGRIPNLLFLSQLVHAYAPLPSAQTLSGTDMNHDGASRT